MARQMEEVRDAGYPRTSPEVLGDRGGGYEDCFKWQDNRLKSKKSVCVES